ncbi:MAG: TIGR00303 family protein [Chloroflexota bacterium]
MRDYPLLDGLPVLLVHEPDRCRAFAASIRGREPRFVFVLGHTETSELEGISAAGVSRELRKFTPAADAEVLLTGRPVCLTDVPSNPNGAPGPAIITRGALRGAGIPAEVVDAGTSVRPAVPARRLSDSFGACITTGRAVPHATELFHRGLAEGERLAALAGDAGALVVGESVPGGTTTALALLVGLGIDAWGRVSSSMAANAHDLKQRVVRTALAAAGLDRDESPPPAERDPLAVAAAVGDPMQPVVAGIVLGVAGRVPVLLAGGTQMTGVLALAAAVATRRGDALDWRKIAIGTTCWVARDRTADIAWLASQIGPVPVLASDLWLGDSTRPGLREYEAFSVKEGVGAGGACLAASLARGASREQLTRWIEQAYDDLSRPL